MATKKRKDFESFEPRLPPPGPPAPAGVEPLPLEEKTVTPRPAMPLAAQVADAAAAQLLIFDELPEDERPRPGDRVLLVGIVWGGSTLVELEQIWTGGDLPVSRLFDLPSVKLPKNCPVPDAKVAISAPRVRGTITMPPGMASMACLIRMLSPENAGIPALVQLPVTARGAMLPRA